jgi:hypothetical protein
MLLMYVRERDSKEDSSALNVGKLSEQHCDGTCIVPQRISCQHTIGTLAITRRALVHSSVRLDTQWVQVLRFRGIWGMGKCAPSRDTASKRVFTSFPAGLQLGQFPANVIHSNGMTDSRFVSVVIN